MGAEKFHQTFRTMNARPEILFGSFFATVPAHICLAVVGARGCERKALCNKVNKGKAEILLRLQPQSNFVILFLVHSALN
jgi:hypothetical protein